MIISHKHKFIFIHPQRCGGTSITSALIPVLGKDDEIYGCEKKYEILSEENRVKNIKELGGEQGPSLWKHSTAKWIKESVGEKVWNSYFKFVMIRNPWEIHYSFYNWWKKDHKWDPEPEGYKEKRDKVMKLKYKDYLKTNLIWNYTLIDFIKCDTEEEKNIDPFASSNSIMSLGVDVDFIGRYEKMKIDFAYICGRLSLPNLELERLNQSRDLDNRKYHLDEIEDDSTARIFLSNRHWKEERYLDYHEDSDEYNHSWNHYMT